MKHESIKDLVNMYIEYFLPLQHKECPFFSAQDLEDLKKLSAAEVDDSNPFGDDYNFFVTTYGLMAGYVKGYKQALKDQKKEISRIDKKSKYAGRNVEPSDIAQDLIAERVAEMEAAREEKAAKREAKKAEKANKSPMSTSKNPTEKKTASKKCGTAAKKTEAKKTATKKATTAKKPVTKKANIAEKKPVKKTTKKTEK